MTVLPPFVALVLFILLPGLPGYAQEKSQASAATVELLFSATSKEASRLLLLSTSDLSILDEGNRQVPVSVRRADELPLALGILLDSSSQNRTYYAGGPSLTEERNAVTQFLKASIRAQDGSLSVEFAAGSPNLTGLISLSDVAGMQEAVDTGRRGNAGAELLQAVANYRKELADVRDGRREVILVANGGTFLGLEMYERILEVLLRNRITMYVVDTYPGPGRYGPRGPSEEMLPKTNLPAQVVSLAGAIKQSLRDLANGSGGFYVEAASTAGVRNAFAQVQRQVNSQYIVTYSLTRQGAGRPFHAIRLRATDNAVTIQAPKGYYLSSE